MNVDLKRITVEQAPDVLKMQIAANEPYLAKYEDYDVNPARETLDKVKSRFTENFTHYLITLDGANAGYIRIRRMGAGDYRLSNMFVLPEHQNKGIGQQAVKSAEARHPDAEAWELDTIYEEPRLRHFYEKLGYKRTGDPQRVNEKMSLITMRK